MSSYQALYRVWRPQTFDDLVGQQVIVDTLKNALQHNQLSHAYLFTGPRGTGKTSAAKILAKAVNCLNQQDGNPCNICESCRAITLGNLADVIEIDAASNNGVEEIRDIRDKVRYAPSQSIYKVYIIDEVHMLTTGAFNALLKTLEEPPSQVLFILATTEPHKIPATIMSRTQRFDFQRITLEKLVSRMQYILTEEGIRYDEEALMIIARVANGGMRDSLSLLDQVLSYQRDHVTAQTALEVTGSISQLYYTQYLLALHQQQTTEALAVLHQVLQAGKQASRFVEELILFCRDMLLTMNTGTNYTLLDDSELELLKQTVSSEVYYDYIQQLNEVQQQMRFATQGDMFVEVMTIRLAQPQSQVVVNETVVDPSWQQKLMQLEQQVQQLQQQLHQVMNAKVAPRQRPAHIQRYALNQEAVFSVLHEATKSDVELMRQQWERYLMSLSPQLRARLLGSHVLAAGPEKVLIAFNNEANCASVQHDAALQAELMKVAVEVFERPVQLTVILQQEWQAVRQQYKLWRNREETRVVPPAAISDSDSESLPVMSMDEASVATLPVETSVVEEGEAPTLEIVEQALSLFGKEAVVIHYDQ